MEDEYGKDWKKIWEDKWNAEVDEKVHIVGQTDIRCYDPIQRRYHITLPSWWREGSIAVIFEESELD